jgi:hypothetical protein
MSNWATRVSKEKERASLAQIKMKESVKGVRYMHRGRMVLLGTSSDVSLELPAPCTGFHERTRRDLCDNSSNEAFSRTRWAGIVRPIPSWKAPASPCYEAGYEARDVREKLPRQRLLPLVTAGYPWCCNEASHEFFGSRRGRQFQVWTDYVYDYGTEALKVQPPSRVCSYSILFGSWWSFCREKVYVARLKMTQREISRFVSRTNERRR